MARFPGLPPRANRIPPLRGGTFAHDVEKVGEIEDVDQRVGKGNRMTMVFECSWGSRPGLTLRPFGPEDFEIL